MPLRDRLLYDDLVSTRNVSLSWNDEVLKREYLSMMQPTSNLPIKGYKAPVKVVKLQGAEGRRFKSFT